MADELDFNGLVRLNADKDRDTSLAVSVFRGAASIAIFQGQGAPKVKIPLGNRLGRFVLPHYLTKLRENANPSYKTELAITRYDADSKKRMPIATLVFGRDDRNAAFVGVTAPEIKPSKFYIRVPLDYDLGDMSIVEQSTLALNGLINVFQFDVPRAQILTSFKREFSGQRGGGYNRGGGGGGSSQPSQAAPLEDEIVF